MAAALLLEPVPRREAAGRPALSQPSDADRGPAPGLPRATSASEQLRAVARRRCSGWTCTPSQARCRLSYSVVATVPTADRGAVDQPDVRGLDLAVPAVPEPASAP